MSELRWVGSGDRKRPATPNLCPGTKVYGEELIRIDGREYRVWDPFRSKLAAALVKGLKTFPVQEKWRILYLGAASGTTASHLSDLVGPEGVVYCVEFSHRPMKDFLISCEGRKNMIPILADARKPEEYRLFVGEVDMIYEDVAQPDQSEILIRNLVYLRPQGYAFLAIKARAIDVTKPPRKIYEAEEKKLEQHLKVLEKITLEPFEKDHAMFVLQKPR